jgi:soluble lytic murein transglycosylase-like protein/TolA-binding protein
MAHTILTQNACAVLLRAFCVFVCAASPAFCLAWPPDTTGAGGFVTGDFRAAQKAIARDSVVDDTMLFEFKQGVAHFKLKDYDDAIAHFQRCNKPSSLLRPLALELIGDIEADRNKPSDAVNAYLAARQDSSLPSEAVSAIQDKMYALVKATPSLVVPYPELAGLSAARRFLETRASDTVSMRLDSLLAKGDYAQLDSALAAGGLDSMGTPVKGALAERLVKNISRDTSGIGGLATVRLFALSYAAYQCKKHATAESLLVRCEQRNNFSKSVDAKKYQYCAGMVSYGLSKYWDAVKTLSSYVKEVGPAPEIVMALGRANRSLGNDSAAEFWYERFATLYPKNPGAQDVLWYVAWEQEEKGNFQKAIRFYDRIVALKKNGTRSDEAFFRSGLCQYKDGRYNRACSTFVSSLKSNDDSPFVNAAQYWKAKSLSALGREKDAVETFRKVAQSAPTDYYACRSREMLALAGDTAQFPSLDTTFGDQDRTHAWIDSLSSGQKQQLSGPDSMQYKRGTICALCGLVDRAAQFLNGLEMRYPSNLGMQYDLALLYKFVNNPTLSYKIGRRFAWRVPAQARAAMPKTLFDLMYPVPFFDVVSREAGRNNLDPFLLYAVMRQESIFDPAIVSRAGAVGLMQIMPGTSREICKALSEPFVADSMYSPGINIRQGAYYIKHLLDQFNGNMVLAIASYNGGPSKANEWYAKNKRSTFDQFIEDIGFTETRGYVKKVLANYWTYRRFAAKSTEK